LRNEKLRRRLTRVGQYDSGANIAAILTLIELDKFDAPLRGFRSGSAATLDDPVDVTPNGSGQAALPALTDPKFEYERIKSINAILLESIVHLVPLHVDDDAVDDSRPAHSNAPQEVKPELSDKVTGARVSKIEERELYDLASE
jgi:hypothetical protein